MTITQIVEVPANRRVHLDFEVPREVPEGKTSIIVQFPDRREAQPPGNIYAEIPSKLEQSQLNVPERADRPPKIKTAEELKTSLERIWAILKDTPVLSNESFQEMRRQDLELEQAKHRRLHGEGN